jgi:hypothetical protein
LTRKTAKCAKDAKTLVELRSVSRLSRLFAFMQFRWGDRFLSRDSIVATTDIRGDLMRAARSFALVLALAALAPAFADDLDGRKIAENADRKNRAKDEVDRVTLPELRKSKKIAGTSRALSFAGTDFSNFDMRTEDLAHHDYKRIADGKAGGRDCYVIEATPKDDDVKEETGYSKRTMWVDKERWTILRCEYVDKAGKPLKTLVSEGDVQVEGGLWRPTKVTMENAQEGTKTIVQHDRGRDINKGVDEGMFSKRALEKP